MQVSEEVEAIEAMGIGPLRFLVAPRMLALVLLMPCLSTVSNLAAIFASSLVCKAFFSIAFPYFLDLVKDSLLIRDIITGILKSFLFGLLIAAIACYRGLTVKGGAAGVGSVDDVQCRYCNHRSDRFRYALQRRLHHVLSDVSTPLQMVELRDVHMRFEEKKVLDGVSLQNRAAGTSGDHGPERQRQEHDFAIDSRHPATRFRFDFFKQFEITRLSRRKLQRVRQHIGMVFQYSALLSSRNVRDNVALPLEELTDKSAQ